MSVISIPKKALNHLKSYIVEEEIEIVYDKIEYKQDKIDRGVLIQGNAPKIVARLREIIENKQGTVNDGGFTGCNSYIYLSDLSECTNLNSYSKWNFIACELNKTYFGIREFSEYCLFKKIHGTVLNIIICDERIKSYEVMIKGFAKHLAKYHMKFNLIEIRSCDIMAVESSISFVLDRHSNHINGECFELENKL